ncbi:MAG: S41 family peptidase [Bacteroidales bacterium]|jgi:carboxyl-terminal processing protease|nr:S41 family peptidase [Bacteroidales bacterium]MCI1732753.1 S41 family peptidase [Bacteroidales bacterium]
MNKIISRIISVAMVVLLLPAALFPAKNGAAAQSKNFKLSQGLEVEYNILKQLSTDYVDTINFGKLLNTGIDAMLNSIDPYTEYIPDENQEEIDLITTASYGGIGAVIRKIDSLGIEIEQVYEGSPAVTYNLEPGDLILKIDGADVKPLSSNECSKRMKGTPGTDVKFLVRKGRTGETKELLVKRDRVHVSDVSYSGLLQDSTGRMTKDGYIKIDGFSMGGGEDVRKAVVSLKGKGAKRIILDLRGNGGGLMDEAVNILSIFLPKGTEVVSAKGRAESANFTAKTKEEPVDTQIPVMVLVNSASASSSEIVTGAMQDLDRGTIIGTRTFGKGLVQSFRPVGYDGRIKLTTSKYYTPSGRCIQVLDYSHRNADGSAGTVPDSLKKAFKTKNGRTVYDGGGITPDIEVKGENYSRPAYSLVLSGIMEEYAVDYYKKHNSIAAPDKFSLTSAEYADFVKFASKKKFDERSGAEVLLDQMIEEAKKDDMYNANKSEYDALTKKLKLTKEQTLNLKMQEIKPLLEEEIVQKYYYIPGRVRSIIRNDEQLRKAVAKWK